METLVDYALVNKLSKEKQDMTPYEYFGTYFKPINYIGN